MFESFPYWWLIVIFGSRTANDTCYCFAGVCRNNPASTKIKILGHIWPKICASTSRMCWINLKSGIWYVQSFSEILTDDACIYKVGVGLMLLVQFGGSDGISAYAGSTFEAAGKGILFIFEWGFKFHHLLFLFLSLLLTSHPFWPSLLKDYAKNLYIQLYNIVSFWWITWTNNLCKVVLLALHLQ